MKYITLDIKIDSNWGEVLKYELANIGFDSMLSTDSGFEASIPEDNFTQAQLDSLIENFKDNCSFDLQQDISSKENWNAEWEKGYPPVLIDTRCCVKHPQHEIDGKYDYILTIYPNMSFGTGHHETTSLVLEEQLAYDHTNIEVLDAGCGTGVLGIFAKLAGAKRVDAFDNDEWASANTLENAGLNNVSLDKVSTDTTLSFTTDTQYDLILANIRKNIVLASLENFSKFLKKGGKVFASGFFESDIEDLSTEAEKHGLSYHHHNMRNNWVCCVLEKK